MLPVFLFILRRWQRGLYFLVLWIPFSGIPTLLSNYSPIALLFKDFALVLPMYLGFFLLLDKQKKFNGIPKHFHRLLFAYIFLILIQVLNPSLKSYLMGFIGLKVWLYYMPLMIISYAAIETRADLQKLLRLIVSVSWVPATVGLSQWFLSIQFGYKATMQMFYGAAAKTATQGFQSFNYGIPIFRLPSTFSFTSQYSTYLWVALLSGFMLSMLDEKKKWRNFGQLTVVFMTFASFFSGARGAFFFIPLILLLCYALHRSAGKALTTLLAAVTIFLPIATYFGMQNMILLENVWKLLVHYSEASLQREFLKALEFTWLGLGTGMNTIAARYGCPDAHGCTIGIENYYGKAVIELGIAGFVLLVAWQISLILTSLRCCKQLQSSELRAVAAASTALFIVMFISNVKSFRLDYEPLNMYYWIFAGFLLRMNAFVVERQQSHSLAVLHNEEAQGKGQQHE